MNTSRRWKWLARLLGLALPLATLTAGLVVLALDENTPPHANFTIDPPTGAPGTVFVFDASSSWDAEETLAWLSIRYDWEGDGWIDTGWLNAYVTTTHQYWAEGVYTPTLMVADSGGLTDIATRTLRVEDFGANTPPTARLDVTPTLGTVWTTFVFSAAGSTDQEEPLSRLQACYDWNDDGGCDTGWWQAAEEIEYTFPWPGVWTARVRVQDTPGLIGEATATVTVTWPAYLPVVTP